MDPLRVFIGYDSRFPEPAHVLAYTIKKYIQFPTKIEYLVLSDLQTAGLIWRNDLAKGSTEFTYTRFLVPYLCNYEGTALFLDNDMLCLGSTDALKPPMLNEFPALHVVKHDPEILSSTKMYGCPQIPYVRKNWSSVMLMRCDKLTEWTLDYVNSAPGLDLHQFKNIPYDNVVDLPYYTNQLHKIVYPGLGFLHYTSGGPWFKEYADCPHADLWKKEYEEWKQILPLNSKDCQ